MPAAAALRHWRVAAACALLLTLALLRASIPAVRDDGDAGYRNMWREDDPEGARATKLRRGERVAIVGGGLAGLAAAERLASTAPASQVTVFEATARFGGRIDSRRVGGGATVDLGAYLIHRAGGGHPLKALAERYVCPCRSSSCYARSATAAKQSSKHPRTRAHRHPPIALPPPRPPQVRLRHGQSERHGRGDR